MLPNTLPLPNTVPNATRPLPVTAPSPATPRSRSTIAQHPLLTAVTLAYLGVVALITLGPQPGGSLFRLLANAAIALSWRLNPGSGMDYSELEFTANVAMFLPVGVLLVLILGPRRWWLAIGFGILLTIGIEAAQAFIPTRVSDARDLVANSAGAVVGSLLGVLLTIRPRQRRA